MLRVSFRRSTRSRLLRASLLLLALFTFIDILNLLSIQHAKRAILSKPTPDVRGQKVFIASIHWNNEAILRSDWNDAVVKLAEYFGAQNVYVSIYESGSWDDTKGALRELDGRLEGMGVERRIMLDDVTHKEEMHKPVGKGWVHTSRGRRELRRIPYLARLRNLSLKPMLELRDRGRIFDKVLFLNDVVFTTEDIAHLLATRDGDYAAACSLDFAHPPQTYDTFALRDSAGHEALTSTYPYFRSSASRHAILRGQPVPVQSCWNGIVAFASGPFYSEKEKEKDATLKFRGIEDSLAAYHLEGSECCLIHADNPRSKTGGVWVNPRVSVAYSREAYGVVSNGRGETLVRDVTGVWWNRVVRWVTSPGFKKMRVQGRVERWKKKDAGRREEGGMCLINEMQVLVENGWAHV